MKGARSISRYLKTFEKVCHMSGVLYIFKIIEKNSRKELPPIRNVIFAKLCNNTLCPSSSPLALQSWIESRFGPM